VVGSHRLGGSAALAAELVIEGHQVGPNLSQERHRAGHRRLKQSGGDAGQTRSAFLAVWPNRSEISLGGSPPPTVGGVQEHAVLDLGNAASVEVALEFAKRIGHYAATGTRCR
jgi:hypothetical protein